MNEQMKFPDTFEEFVEQYGFIDSEEIYTNASWLIPVFRVNQWLEHIQKPTNMIDKSNFSQEQYKADTDTAYQCGYEASKSDNSVLEDIKAEIRQWYWDADKQAIAKDPCVVDAMVDLFIRTVDKHISGKEKE